MRFNDMMDFANYIATKKIRLESSSNMPEGSELIIIKNNQFHESEEYYLKDDKVYKVENMETASKTKVWEDNFEQLIRDVKTKYPNIKLAQISFYLNQFLNEQETLNNLKEYIDKSTTK